MLFRSDIYTFVKDVLPAFSCKPGQTLFCPSQPSCSYGSIPSIPAPFPLKPYPASFSELRGLPPMHHKRPVPLAVIHSNSSFISSFQQYQQQPSLFQSDSNNSFDIFPLFQFLEYLDSKQELYSRF